jgi:exopolysaccharide biosynthesis polyprenyl glycosylphosphotransferase
MSIYGNQSRHWDGVGRRFVTDMLLVVVSFYLATVLRFESWWPEKLGFYLPSILICALLLPSVIYILGLYTEESMHYSGYRRFALLLIAFALMFGFALAYGSIHYSARIGRGVMMGAAFLSAISVWINHELLRRNAARSPLRLAYLVLEETDVDEAYLLAGFDKPQMKFVGVITGANEKTDLKYLFPVLGCLADFKGSDISKIIDGIVVKPSHINRPEIASMLRRLRYQGIQIQTLIDTFEDIYQMAPLELIDGGWLLQASSMPRMIYIQKLKRAFDIFVSLMLIMLLGPVCLLAMLMIKLTSSGPVLFRQVRCGRHGREFVLLKLRSMRVDAESNGIQWSSKGDSRVTLLGRLLRKYRVDEIPQLINILRGEMSFVGPRPERPEFVCDLEMQIPHYRERLHLQPGLTGWAQVCYPYGESVSDARRKLEYDLYYMKHMSIALDLFTLLDTIRIILRGGAQCPSPSFSFQMSGSAGFLSASIATSTKPQVDA